MLASGTKLRDRYIVLDTLNKGGMGYVYKVRDLNLQREVALKVSKPDPLHRQALKRESAFLADLNHPALPWALDYFPDEDLQCECFVLEYIAGDDLEEQVKKSGKPFELEAALKWTDQLLDVLVYLHGRNIVHKDIKPSNLKINSRGKIVLLDFGVAYGSTVEMFEDTPSVDGYSKPWASPEQLNNESVDERSDLYSLAVTIYYLVTASRPPTVKDRERAAVRGASDPLESAFKHHLQTNKQFAKVLLKALALRPDLRYSSAAEMRSALPKEPGLRSVRTLALSSPIDSEESFFVFDDFTTKPQSKIDRKRELGSRGLTQATPEELSRSDAGPDKPLEVAPIRAEVEMARLNEEARRQSVEEFQLQKEINDQILAEEGARLRAEIRVSLKAEALARSQGDKEGQLASARRNAKAEADLREFQERFQRT